LNRNLNSCARNTLVIAFVTAPYMLHHEGN